jgi:hypothetical protein
MPEEPKYFMLSKFYYIGDKSQTEKGPGNRAFASTIFP